jgi:hypothetical protein
VDARRRLVLLACICAALVLGAVARSAPDRALSFAAVKSYATGGSGDLAIADLNGDGKPDLAAPNDANTVSVLLNRGDGRYAPRRHYATGHGPESLVIADLNGDGKPDLATANAYASAVSVLLNRGDGRFEPRSDYATGADPGSIAIADLNGDGKPDLATANFHADTVSVLLNRGDGSFTPPSDYATGAGLGSLALADLNGDGRQDVLTSDGNTVSVLINKPGLCDVQPVTDMVLAAARRKLAGANCRVGKVRRVYSTDRAAGWVLSQKPRFGVVRRGGAKVNLVVSRGRKR